MKVSKRLVFVVVGSLLILQFALLLVYSYLYENNQAPFQISFDPVTAFLMSWILFCIGIVILITMRR
jgi:hypothetical protein